MDTLFPELLAMIYHELMPKDSCRFSLVSKRINRALPVEIRLFHEWYKALWPSLNVIGRCKYDIYYIMMFNAKAIMSIRKYYDKVSIYQMDPNATSRETNLYVYTYVGSMVKYRATLAYNSEKEYTINTDGSHDAYGALDSYSEFIVDEAINN